MSDHSYCRVREAPILNSIDNIIIPKVAKTRGRPKGCSKTVIGLPKFNCLKKKPFSKRSATEKKIFILQLIVAPACFEEVYKKDKKIEIADINSDLPHSLLHEYINLNVIREYCSESSWHKLNILLSDMRNNVPWYCEHCNHILNDKSSVICASCLKSYHLICIGLKQVPKKKNWMCRYCPEEKN